jgi:hypothetical protein
LLRLFQDSAVADELGRAKLALRESLDGMALPELAHDYSKIVPVTDDLGRRLRGLFDGLENSIDTVLAAGGISTVNKMVGQVASEFVAIQIVLDDLAEIRSNEG